MASAALMRAVCVLPPVSGKLVGVIRRPVLDTALLWKITPRGN